MRCSTVFCLIAAVSIVRPCMAQTTSDRSELATRKAVERGLPLGGQPENRWRYRYTNGRWWYWTRENRWSYFDGRQWIAAHGSSGLFARPVDPALLRLEAKEGVLGARKWKRVPNSGLGGLPMSGTQGSAGGNPSGSFTDPGGMPSAVNTTTGSYFGYGRAPAAPPTRMQGRR
jgi:hypothetical protein